MTARPATSFRVLRVIRRQLIREAVTVLLFASLLLQSVQAAAPDWWASRGVINPSPQRPPDDFVALNQGQLKFLASMAWLQMELSLPGGAGPELTQVVSGWRLVRPEADDYAVANVGQLKEVARPFYERLAAAGLLSLPGWMLQPGAGATGDFDVANLGQAKMIFSFTIPQALGTLPQRLSGNGVSGLGGVVPPAGYEWGSGNPPNLPVPPAVPGLMPGSDHEVSTTATSVVDPSAAPVAAELVIEYEGATGTVGKSRFYEDDGAGNYVLGPWYWDGTAYTYSQEGSQEGLSSKGELTAALASLSTIGPDTPASQVIMGGWRGAQGGFNMGSYADEWVIPEGDEDAGEVLSASWSGEHLQARVYYDGGSPTAPSRTAWWRVLREVTDEDWEVVRREVEFYPCTIASSKGGATSTSFTSQCWDTPREYEMAWVNLVLPQVLQVNDGDTDGDGIPDYADGLKTGDYPSEENLPDLPQTVALPALSYDARASSADPTVRFTYPASDPAGVTSTTAGDGSITYQPAPGALRLWRTVTDEPYTVQRDPRSVAAGGDFVPSGVWLEVADLGTLRCESVAPSEAEHDQVVIVEIDPDGAGPEAPYMCDKCFLTSLGLQLEQVVNGAIAGRDTRLQPSLPNPTIDLANVSVTNPRTTEDGAGLLVDIAFSGTVHSAVCDLTAGTETGTIQTAYASVNDAPLPQSLVALQVSKGNTPAGQDRPYPYEGAFSHTLTGVSVTAGANMLKVLVNDPLYRLSGTVEVEFEIEATPPPALGGATGTTVELELPGTASTLAAGELRLSIEVDDQPLVSEVLTQQGGGLLYRSADGQAAFEFLQAPALSGLTEDALHGYVTLPAPGWQGALFSPLAELGADTGTFLWSAQQTYGDYWGWQVSVGEVAEPVASAAGEFHPYTVRMVGPPALLAQVRQMHLGGRALPVVAQGGVYRVADPENPGRPVTLASLPIEAVKPLEVPPEQSISQELAALGVGWGWEELDVPEEKHDAMEEAMSRRLAQNASTEDGPDFMERLKRQADTAVRDGITPSFYGGFIVGFVDNPWSSAKDGCSTLLGIGKKVAKVAWLVSPVGMVWEFTFGDSYQGEIQAAVKTARSVSAAVSGAYQFAKKWGEPVCIFLAKLMQDIPDPVALAMALRGEIPELESMGPEIKIAIQVITQIVMMADDAWTGMSSYQRGYWLGYIAFEVAAVVVAGVLSAPAGGAGGAALLARHTPKLTRLMGYVTKLLGKFEDIPGISRLVNKVEGFLVAANKLGDFCFEAGTPVLTVQGQRPIEKIKAGDYVWSRAEGGGAWGWRPVARTFTTHPDTLVQVSYEAAGGARDAAAADALGLARQVVPESGGAAQITCTPGHLVRARRSVGGAVAAFIAAGALMAGDVLTLADGRDAAVRAVSVEHAAPGRVFTTHNFTVADHHTYFAGALPVWVHNEGLDYCGTLTKKMTDIITKKGDDTAKYFDHLVEARNDLDFRTGNLTRNFPDKFWAKSGNKISQKMMDAVNDGSLTPDKIPTVAQWDADFFKRPPGFDYKNWELAREAGMIARSGYDLHHIIPKHIFRRLKTMNIKPSIDLDDTPGYLMDKDSHATITARMANVLTSKKMSAIMEQDGPEGLIEALAVFYEGEGHAAQAKIVRAFFN